jgi:mRNA interferase MazF
MDIEKIKKYDEWNDQKKMLADTDRKLFFKEGEIWWCSLGMNLGEEVYGKGKVFRRPVIVLRKVTGSSCIVIPTTSQEKVGSWYYRIDVDGVVRYVMMHQIRFVTAKRFGSRVSSMSKNEFAELKNAVAKFYGIVS